MPLINCEINLILRWSSICVITNSAGAGTIAITITVGASLNYDNAKLLERLKYGFKRTIIWNEYQSKMSTERQNQYLEFLFDPSFQGVYRPSVLSFEGNVVRTGHTIYFLPAIKQKVTMLWLIRKTYLMNQ